MTWGGSDIGHLELIICMYTVPTKYCLVVSKRKDYVIFHFCLCQALDSPTSHFPLFISLKQHQLYRLFIGLIKSKQCRSSYDKSHFLSYNLLGLPAMKLLSHVPFDILFFGKEFWSVYLCSSITSLIREWIYALILYQTFLLFYDLPFSLFWLFMR